MKQPWDIYNMILKTQYTASGDCVDWAVLVDDEERTVWLIFEESDGRRDWINNLKFPTKLYKHQESCMRAACGWGDAWKSCNDEVMNAFIEQVTAHPDYRPHITGWSYGGAMCLYAAEDFNYRTGFRADVTTFGAPKPLWGKKTLDYVYGCCGIVRQWTNRNDCVCALPPFPGYCRLRTDSCGDRFSLLKWLRPKIYHCLYGDSRIYA